MFNSWTTTVVKRFHFIVFEQLFLSYSTLIAIDEKVAIQAGVSDEGLILAL